mgnify:FL=1
MKQNIRHIIFDLGGVLLNLDVEGCTRAFEKAGLKDIRSVLTGTNEGGIFSEYERGEIGTPEFRDGIRQLASQSLTDDEIDRMWVNELLDIPQEKLDLLVSLRSKYDIYLLSNTNELHWQHVVESLLPQQNYRVEDLFKETFLSFRMKLAKPDPEIFREVLRQAGLKPEETLFIDDSAVNCQAAQSVSIQTEHYKPGNDLSLLFS